MTLFRVIIPTYNRPERLQALTVALLEEARQVNDVALDLHIYDDGSIPPASSDLASATIHARVHGGKHGWSQLVNAALQHAKQDEWDYLLFLPDDVTLAEGFFSRMMDTWHAIDDDDKAMLGLMVDERTGHLAWVQRHPQLLQFGTESVWLHYWNDMCFLADRRCMELLRYKCNTIPSDFWQDNPRRSSGVGRQISKRLYAEGGRIYNVSTTLVYHGNHESQMHPSVNGQHKRPTTEPQ